MQKKTPDLGISSNKLLYIFRNLASKCKDTEPQQPKKRDSALSQQGEDKREKVIIMYDYSAHGVTVKKGTILPLLSTTNNEWWKVELENGKRDYVPASYVKKIDQQVTETNYIVIILS